MKYLALNREKIPELTNALNLLLANYQVYNQKIKNFHWNVKGNQFFELHRQFETLYDQAHDDVDQLAERIKILKGEPWSTLKKYLDKAEIEEITDFLNDRHIVETILNDHYILLKNMRKTLRAADAAGDEGTIDLISGMMRFIEKKSWMLDSWIEHPVKANLELNSLS